MQKGIQAILEECERIAKATKGKMRDHVQDFISEAEEKSCSDSAVWIHHADPGIANVHFLPVTDMSPAFFLKNAGAIVVCPEHASEIRPDVWKILCQQSGLIITAKDQALPSASWNVIAIRLKPDQWVSFFQKLQNDRSWPSILEWSSFLYQSQLLENHLSQIFTQEKEESKVHHVRIKAENELQASKKNLESNALKGFSDVARSQKDRFRAQIKKLIDDAQQTSHTLQQKLKTNIESIQHLDFSKGSKQNVHRLPEENIQIAKKDVIEEAINIFNKTAEQYENGLEYLSKKAGQTLSEMGLAPLSYHYVHPSLQEFETKVHKSIANQRNFETTSANRGMMEYFMGARIYYMFLIMGLSMMGLSGFLMKHRIYLAPLSILLFGFGGYQIWSNKQKEKEEFEKKNLDSARQFMKAENEKTITDLLRIVEKTFSDAFTQTTDEIVAQTQSEAQKVLHGDRTQEHQQRALQQSILKSIQNQDRYFVDVERSLEGLSKTLQRQKRDIRMEAERLFTQVLREDERRDRPRD